MAVTVDLSAANRTDALPEIESVNLHISIVVFDAAQTELVQTLAHNPGVVVHGCADLTNEGRIFDCVKKLLVYYTIVWRL